MGKTYTANLLKAKIEEECKRWYPLDVITCALYDNFNPNTIGLNVRTTVLNQASQYNPVILVVEDINLVFDTVLSNDLNRDFPQQVTDINVGPHRGYPWLSNGQEFKHTNNIQVFHNMMDAIAETPYLIVLYLTNVQNIHEVTGYESFITPERVDMLVSMNQLNSVGTHVAAALSAELLNAGQLVE